VFNSIVVNFVVDVVGPISVIFIFVKLLDIFHGDIKTVGGIFDLIICPITHHKILFLHMTNILFWCALGVYICSNE
jgi:hypothetical protein